LEKDQELRRQLEDDIERTQRRLAERVQWGGSYYQHAATSYREQQAKQRVRLKQLLRGQRTTDPGELRRSAELQAKSLNQMEDVEVVFGTVQLIPFFLGPALWVGWAFLTRGGLSYWLLGIAPVRRDGRLAGRFQCAWRALLVWVPVAGLLLLSYWLEAWYWSLWGTAAAPVWALWLSTVIWWATWLLLGAYIILALRYPTRSLHDRLAGTYLVPR
jgi:hypothetical protein